MRLLFVPVLCVALAACSGEESESREESKPAEPVANALGELPAGPVTIDCARAAGQAEQAVCADPELAALDRLAGPADGTLKSDRDNCIRADELRPCLIETYALRIARQARSGAVDKSVVVGPVTFRCGRDDVAATFINSTPGYVILSNGRQAVLQRSAAASGVRYEGRVDGENWSFWNKGREATLVRGTGQDDCAERLAADQS